MRSRHLALLSLLLLVGCGGGPILDETMTMDVQPQPLVRGLRAVVTVDAPLDAVEVIGRVKVMGSPEAIFRKDEAHKRWYFSGMIPFSPWVTPGTYRLRVTVKLPEGRSRYVETQVGLK